MVKDKKSQKPPKPDDSIRGEVNEGMAYESDSKPPKPDETIRFYVTKERKKDG